MSLFCKATIRRRTKEVEPELRIGGDRDAGRRLVEETPFHAQKWIPETVSCPARLTCHDYQGISSFS